jgi:hypothetical protein
MRQIILSYESYIQGWGGELGTITIPESGTAHDWIAELAKKGYFNDPRLVAFDFDPQVRQYNAAGFFGHFFGVLPPQIWNRASATLNSDFKNMPLSLCFVANLDSRKATAHTPLLWTYGLTGDGRWINGIWGNIGGLVGYFGGGVKWVSSIADDPFLKWDGSGPTHSAWEAINPDAEVFDYRGRVNADGSVSLGGGGDTGGGESGNGGDGNEDHGNGDDGNGGVGGVGESENPADGGGDGDGSGGDDNEEPPWEYPHYPLPDPDADR